MNSFEFTANDSLLRMLTLQARFQRELYGVDVGDLSPAERVQYVKDMVLALTDELHEALAETTWKPWATAEPTIDEDAFFGEVVDALHFLMNLMLVARADSRPKDVWRELVTRYEAKNERNRQRQAEGYDGVSGKCPRCRRALDDEGVSCRHLDADDFFPERYLCAVTDRAYLSNGTLLTT